MESVQKHENGASSILRIGLRKNTQDRNDCDLAPFPPGKTPWSLFALFFKKVTFFRPKKGSPNRLILFLKARLGGSTFRTPKNRCVKLPVSTSMCPPPYFPLAKMNYFPDEEERRRTKNISDFALPKVMALRAISTLVCPPQAEIFVFLKCVSL